MRGRVRADLVLSWPSVGFGRVLADDDRRARQGRGCRGRPRRYCACGCSLTRPRGRSSPARSSRGCGRACRGHCRRGRARARRADCRARLSSDGREASASPSRPAASSSAIRPCARPWPCRSSHRPRRPWRRRSEPPCLRAGRGRGTCSWYRRRSCRAFRPWDRQYGSARTAGASRRWGPAPSTPHRAR